MFFSCINYKMLCAVIFLVIASIFGCNSTYVENIQNVVEGNNKFTANTYKQLLQTSGNQNLIVSGLSAEVVLSLLAHGAKGATCTQLLKGLHLPENLDLVKKAYQEITAHLKVNSEDLKLLSANKIYPAEGFSILKAFNDTAVNVYDAGVENLDYANSQSAANTINQWVEDQTNNKIKNLINPSMVDSSTVLVLVNALYLSGRWKNEFERYNTEKKTFYTSATDSKEIDTMYTEADALYGYNDKLKAAFLELELVGGNVSMTIVLPDSKTGLEAIEKNLAEYLKPQTLTDSLVNITLPKFTIETETNFKPILQSFGIEDIFTDKADLSGISGQSSLHVDFVVQKAFIDVNEHGVEAAAATAVGTNYASLVVFQKPKHTFKADHPFLFYIKENDSNLILFIGRFNQ